MNSSPYEDILDEIEVSADHAFFYPRLCSFLIHSTFKTPTTEEEEIAGICSEEFDDLSRRLDRTMIQESCSVRNVIKARRIAQKLISDEGEFRDDLLPLFIKHMRASLFSLAPNRSFDAIRDEHILNVLLLLESNKEQSNKEQSNKEKSSKELLRLLKHLSRPFSNRLAEQIIRDTLLLSPTTALTDAHVRRAALSAWLTYLRQSLGSCFATAPAILVQQEQPDAFLKDLDELMHTGSMKRTYAGREHSVPMSQTWGNGDLQKPFFLQKDLSHNEQTIWMSPGLIDALSAIQFFQPNLSLSQKGHALRKALQESLQLLEKREPLFVTCAEELLRVLLLSRHGLVQQQVDDYLARPKTMMHTGMLLHAPVFKGSKENPVVLFLKDFQDAKRAFKLLADNPLLKSWEFTLASFSEINLDFCRWNLYTSLGFNYEDPGGIGACLYGYVSQKVEQANLALKELQVEYDQVLAQMRYLEGRAQQASTEKEISWVKMEYQSRQTELYHIDQVRLSAHEKATKISGLYEFLMRQYDQMFCDYFQEVYDADLHDVASGPFDDSPAGFRLIYKHGRTNPSQWTPIHSLAEFIEALASFFTITESDLRTHPAVRGIDNELSFLITRLVGHIRSEEFMEAAFYRMAKAHGVRPIANPLENLEKIEKKPWVYTSGGSMATLVSAYFRREEKPTEVSRWVENETELLAFMIDTVKQLPQKVLEMYLKEPQKSILIHSPTHAFLLKPGYFQNGWKNDMYTYSWIKHQFVEPALAEIEKIFIDEEMGQDILHELLSFIPQDFRPRFRQVFERLPYRLSTVDFRSYVLNTVQVDRGLKAAGRPVLSSDDLDAILYSSIPYQQKETLRDLAREVLKEVLPVDLHSKIEEVVQEGLRRFSSRGVMAANRVLELLKALICLALQTTKQSRNLHKLCLEQLRRRKLLLPQPIIFADSNWIKDYFAFVVSPATGELELWSVDFYGVQGRPISYWKMWVNGSRKEPQWGIYNKPHEYVKNMLAIQKKI